jgi:hypothetical protein
LKKGREEELKSIGREGMEAGGEKKEKVGEECLSVY